MISCHILQDVYILIVYYNIIVRWAARAELWQRRPIIGFLGLRDRVVIHHQAPNFLPFNSTSDQILIYLKYVLL